MSRQTWITLGVMGLLIVGVFLLTVNSGNKPTRSFAGPGSKQSAIQGTIKVELNPDKAPISVKNFLQYVDDRHYDGTIFHRVMSDFMIQGGGFTPDMKEKGTKAPIKNEADNGLSNTQGTIAMARTSIPDSATSQFYINVVDNSQKLDRGAAPDGVGYAVFGKVIEGMDVVDKIRAVATKTKGPHENVPAQDVIIKSIRRAENQPEGKPPVVVIEVEQSGGR